MPSRGPFTVFFACVGNSARSQIAEGLCRAIGGRQVVCASGGSKPLGRVLPEAIAVLRERGIDIAHHESRAIDEAFVGRSDVIVTMGCGDDACPAFSGKRLEDWALPDPHGKDLAAFRAVCDELETRIRDLFARHGVTPAR